MPLNIAVRSKSLTRVVLTGLAGLIAGQAMAQTIKGTASYRERMALPSGAVFEATLEEVSRADAPAQVVASTRFVSPGNLPIAFTITYDPAKIISDHRYSVRARIFLADKILFTTATAAPVITHGTGTNVSLMLRQASAGGQTAPPKPEGNNPSASPLQGTSWQLIKFQGGGDDKPLVPDDRAKYTIEFGAGGQLVARIDCNRGRGTWKSSGPGDLRFGALALTRAKCPEGSLHDRIVKVWDYFRSYFIRDGHLFLSLMADGGVFEFEPLKQPKA